jgi:signal transduction histidine kinase
MLLPTSPEFLALCQSQLQLLTQGLGASMGAIYLAEGANERDPQLVPIAVLPEGGGQDILPPVRFQSGLVAPDRLVLPLNHEGMVLGLLVTERLDRLWNDPERLQVDQVVRTLTLSCVLDQRSQWLERRRQQEQGLLDQQHDRMDNLLHQFRNPLTALRTFGKLMMRRLQPGESNHEVAASIVRESDRLQELLLQFDEAIDLHLDGAIEVAPGTLEGEARQALPAAGLFGDWPLALEPCDLVGILRPVLASAEAIAQEKGLLLQVELGDLAPVQGSPQALREVLSNLVDNAIKYTPEPGQVHVRTQRTPAGAEVYITDNGLGVPPEDLARLFQRHFRGAQAAGKIPGTGLGLCIAQELMRSMGGDIEVFSPGLAFGWIGAGFASCGTTVKVSLQYSSTIL